MRPTREEYIKSLLYKTDPELKETLESVFADLLLIFDLDKSPTVKVRKSRTAMNDMRSIFNELRRRNPTM